MKAIAPETVYFPAKEPSGPAGVASETTIRFEITFPAVYPAIPESFERALQDVKESRVIDLDQALNEPAPNI